MRRRQIINPEYTVWFHQDQLIQNVLMASVDSTIASTVAITATATKKKKDGTLCTMPMPTNLKPESSACTINLLSLQRMFALLLTIYSTFDLYLQHIQSLSDELAATGAPVANEELIIKILIGLGPEYHEISVAIHARDIAITYEELYKKLIDHELFLKHEDMKKILPPITAAIARKNNFNNKNNRIPNNSTWRSSVPKKMVNQLAPFQSSFL
ncbi:hypothetical protein ACH5RR_039232 [Cinchona calisaya]|uniref:Uncharacterized protein n=1 Tax=Cinchona calisaya TaxID=153742 RepID=A0ABD2Y146_9GENT